MTIELGELLVLMTGAHRSFSTLHGEARTWRHRERQQEAWARWTEKQGARSSSMVSFGLVDEDSEPPPMETESRVRLWLLRPDRMREEASGDDGESLLVQVGETWWSFNPGFGARTNAGRPDYQHGSQLERAMIDPRQLLASYDFEVTGRVAHAGRPAIRVEAICSLRDAYAGAALGLMGDWPQELLVDAERGVLLRTASLLDGEPFALTEFTSIAFDEELPEDVFVFVPPPGEELLDAGAEQEGFFHDVPLHEAARLAPFEVFAPASVPDDWRLTVYFTASSERRAWPASVGISYSSRTGVNVGISEMAAGEAGLPSTAPGGGEWRIEEIASGELRLWEPDPSGPERGMPRMALLERSGTRIRIGSGELSLDELAELAAGLVPAPTEPPGPR